MTIVLSLYEVKVLMVAFLATIALSVTIIGVRYSTKHGASPSGWSDGVALFNLVIMAALTFAVMYWLMFVRHLDIPFGIYAGLIIFYIFLFAFAQRLAVMYLKRNKRNG